MSCHDTKLKGDLFDSESAAANTKYKKEGHISKHL